MLLVVSESFGIQQCERASGEHNSCLMDPRPACKWKLLLGQLFSVDLNVGFSARPREASLLYKYMQINSHVAA